MVRPDDRPAQDRSRAGDLTSLLPCGKVAGRTPILTAAPRGRGELERMHPQVIFNSFGYLTQAAAVTIALSLAGIALGFVIGALVCVARLSGRRWLQRLGGGLCQRLSRRAAARAVAVHLLFPRRARPRRAGAGRGDRRAGALAPAPIRRKSCAARSTPCRAARARPPWRSAIAGLDVWRRILLPQALRISIPPLINEFILLLKASSLVSVVGIAELTRVSMNIASMTYRPLEAYVGGGLFYLAINLASPASARSPSGGSRRSARDEPRRPLALPALAGQRLRRHGLLLERRRRARAHARLRHRACLTGRRLPPLRWAVARLHRGLSRHAVSHAALSALRRRPVRSGSGSARRRRAFSASASTPRPISPRSSAPVSPPCPSARSRRRRASA